MQYIIKYKDALKRQNMGTKKKRLITILIILALLVLGGLFLYHRYLRPEGLKEVIERNLEKRLNQEISVKSARLNVLKGMSITLTDVRMEGARETYLKVDTAIIRFSLWQLIFGNHNIINLKLIRPEGALRLDTISLPKSKKKGLGLPDIDIEKGSIKTLYKDYELSFDDVNACVGKGFISVDAALLGSTFRLNARHIKDAWSAELAIKGLLLEGITPRLSGRSDLNIKACLSDKGSSAELTSKVSDLKIAYPGSVGYLDHLSCNLKAEGGLDHIGIKDISIKTPILEIEGNASVYGIKDIDNAVLDLDMASKEFDYEEVVNFLPAQCFPESISFFLCKQIREGRSRFSSIKYSGRLMDMKDSHAFMKNLYIEEELYSQSFGAGYSQDRITDITGTVIFDGENLKFNNLSGHIGDSTVKSVDVHFLKVADPGLRVNAGINLDMAAKDFIMAWRACMVSKGLYKILAPVTHVKKGRVAGNAWAYWDKLSGQAAQILGEMHVDKCSFNWGKNSVEALTGDVTSPDFGSDVEVTLKGILNELPIDEFNMSLKDPFGEQLYTYSVKTHAIPDVDVFHIDRSATVILKGNGKGPEIKGDIDIVSKGFDFFGTYYRPVKGVVTGRGKVKGNLWPVFTMEFSDIAIKVPSQKLTLSARFTQSGGNMNIGGRLSLEYLKAYAKKKYWPLKGGLFGHVDIAWGKGKNVSLKGNLICSGALIFYNDMATTLNGTLLMHDEVITSKEFCLKASTVKSVLSGSLDIRHPLYFKGKLIVDGLKIDAHGTGSTGLLKAINGDGILMVKNMDAYGVVFDEATANAELKDGILKLDNIESSSISGIARGSAIVNTAGNTTFDITLSLKDAEIKRVFHSLFSGDVWIEGDMRLAGRLWGSADSLNGDIVFLAKDGRIMKFSLISKIFATLNVYKILTTGRVDLLSRGFSYNFISSTFKIRDGVMQFDDFYLDSNSIQFSAVGKYDTSTRMIDAIVGVQPLETIDKAISLVPILGWVLTSDKGGFLVISLDIKGDINDPSVVIAPINTISKPIIRTLLNTLKLPKEIITQPDILIPGRGNAR